MIEADSDILIADANTGFREALIAQLHGEGVRGVGCPDAAGLDAALSGARRPALALLDLQLPELNGFSGLRDRIGLGLCRVAVMSDWMDIAGAERALAFGAAGAVPKSLSVRAQAAAVRFMAEGGVYRPLSLARPGTSPVGPINTREMHVLHGIAAGWSNKEIARDLDLSEVTVKLHVKTLSRKLGARNRTHAAMLACELGLVGPLSLRTGDWPDLQDAPPTR